MAAARGVEGDRAGFHPTRAAASTFRREASRQTSDDDHDRTHTAARIRKAYAPVSLAPPSARASGLETSVHRGPKVSPPARVGRVCTGRRPRRRDVVGLGVLREEERAREGRYKLDRRRQGRARAQVGRRRPQEQDQPGDIGRRRRRRARRTGAPTPSAPGAEIGEPMSGLPARRTVRGEHELPRRRSRGTQVRARRRQASASTSLGRLGCRVGVCQSTRPIQLSRFAAYQAIVRRTPPPRRRLASSRSRAFSFS